MAVSFLRANGSSVRPDSGGEEADELLPDVRVSAPTYKTDGADANVYWASILHPGTFRTILCTSTLSVTASPMALFHR